MSEQLPAVQERHPIPTASIQVGDRGVVFQSFDDVARFCQAVSRSGLAPKELQTPEKIMVAMMAGIEAGLTPMQAIQSVAVINGRPSMWGDACLALAMARPEFVDIQEAIQGEGDLMEAACCIERKGRTKTLRTFSVMDAKKAGLWGKGGPWTNYPRRMLQMRARGFALRDSFPDALKGIGIREEVQDIPTREIAPTPLAIEFPKVPETVAPELNLEGKLKTEMEF